MNEFNTLPAKGLILIVEDSHIIQDLLLQMAVSLGFEAYTSDNGLDALTVLSEKKYDIIIVDNQMPVLNGFEMTDRIRHSEGLNRHTPIILMTGQSEKDFREKCLQAGMNDFLGKPFDIDKFEKVLDFWLHKGQKHLINKTVNPNHKSANETQPAATQLTHPALQRLEKLAGGTPEGLRKFIEIYVQEMALNLNLLDKAITENSVPDMAIYAHACVGTSAFCGFTSLVSLLNELEALIRSQELSNTKHIYSKIYTEFLQIKAILQV